MPIASCKPVLQTDGMDEWRSRVAFRQRLSGASHRGEHPEGHELLGPAMFISLEGDCAPIYDA